MNIKEITSKKSFDLSDLKDVQNNSISTSKIWQDKVKRRKESFQVKGINGNIFRISKAGRIVFTKRQRHIIKQLVMDAMIQQLTLEQSLMYISDKLGLYDIKTKKGIIVSQSIYYNWVNIIKKEYLEVFNYYQKDKYAYISEYMQRIGEIKRNTRELWKLFDNNKNKPQLQKSLLADLKENTIILNKFYELLPVMVRQPIEFYESFKNGYDEDGNNNDFNYQDDEDYSKEKIPDREAETNLYKKVNEIKLENKKTEFLLKNENNVKDDNMLPNILPKHKDDKNRRNDDFIPLRETKKTNVLNLDRERVKRYEKAERKYLEQKRKAVF